MFYMRMGICKFVVSEENFCSTPVFFRLRTIIIATRECNFAQAVCVIFVTKKGMPSYRVNYFIRYNI